MAQNPEQSPSRPTRRTILKWLAGLGIGLPSAWKLLDSLSDQVTDQAQANEPEWPTEQEAILNKIKELEFVPGSHLGGTFFPRKVFWELAQDQKMKGEWPEGKSETDWRDPVDITNIMEPAVRDMAEQLGIKSVRLEIVPFELTQDGITYDWTPLEAMIDLLLKYGITPDLAIGPLNFPYDPGVRLPIELEHRLADDLAARGLDHITIDAQPDPQTPETSQAIYTYALNFLNEIMTRYGHDQRIGKFYLGNEWPDTNNVEGTSVTMSVGKELMLTTAAVAKELTDKKIAINTNIHVSRPEEIVEKLGDILSILGSQGILGIDVYPTREQLIGELRRQIPNYDELFTRLRELFPDTEFEFTEFETELFATEGLAGQPWAQIFAQHPELIKAFYEAEFPSSLETHVIASRVKEIGIWGIPLLLVLMRNNYTFPAQMMKTIAETMAEAA